MLFEGGFCPREVFFTKGVGFHKDKLSSFEEALRNAGIARFNLVRVSSIFPPHCKILPKNKALKKMKSGEITFVVISQNETNEKHRLISSSVGVAIPADRNAYGYLSEFHSFGQTEQETGDYAEDLAASMLATILGVTFDPELSWNKKKELWKISGKIVKTANISQSATGKQNGLWTTVLSAAVFVP